MRGKESRNGCVVDVRKRLPKELETIGAPLANKFHRPWKILLCEWMRSVRKLYSGVSVTLFLTACQLGILDFSVTSRKAGLSFPSRDPIRHLALGFPLAVQLEHCGGSDPGSRDRIGTAWTTVVLDQAQHSVEDENALATAYSNRRPPSLSMHRHCDIRTMLQP